MMQRACYFQAPGSDGGPCPHHVAKGQGRVRRTVHSSSGEVKARQVRAPQPGTAPRPSPTTAHRTCVLSSLRASEDSQSAESISLGPQEAPSPAYSPASSEPAHNFSSWEHCAESPVCAPRISGWGAGEGLQIPRLSGKGEFYHSEEERTKPNSLNYGTSKNAPQIPVGDFRAGEIRHTCNSFPH